MLSFFMPDVWGFAVINHSNSNVNHAYLLSSVDDMAVIVRSLLDVLGFVRLAFSATEIFYPI